ncbi:unnamed protein product [Acanthosepion pharaonis]|uniref:Uncharacterized protein n=1 Tax=Acanthosepion pharaonis TaxID=158019 RepID=A0A812BLY8_ACAPH|nr:unnamed protein product [Sepia pharaonis]
MLLLYLFWAGPGRFPPLAWTARLGGNAVVVSVLGRALARPDSYPPLGQLALGGNAVVVSVLGGPGRFLPAAWTARLGGNAVVVSVLGWAGPIPTRCLEARLGGNAVVVSVLGWAGPIPTAAWTARLGGNAVVVSVLGWARPIPTRFLDSSPWRKCCCCICSGSEPGRFLPAAWTARPWRKCCCCICSGSQADSHPFLDSSPWRKCCCCICSGWARPIVTRCLDSSPWRKCCCYLFWVGPGRFLPPACLDRARLGWNGCCCICFGLGRPIPYPLLGQHVLGNAVVVSVLGRAGPIPTCCLDSSPWEMPLLYLFRLGRARSYPLLGQLALAEMLLFCSWLGRAGFQPAA